MTYIVSPSRIEPARLEDDIPLDLVETANRLIQSSRGLGRNLPARTLADLAAMVRMMNSYYSNRIEGNNTRPRDIERALAGDFDADPGRRALQPAQAAHVPLDAGRARRAGAAAWREGRRSGRAAGAGVEPKAGLPQREPEWLARWGRDWA